MGGDNLHIKKEKISNQKQRCSKKSPVPKERKKNAKFKMFLLS